MASTPGKSWILTGSLENFRINAERGFNPIGFKEGRRNQAEQAGPGDEVFFYLTGVQAFGAIARVTSEMWHLAFQGQLRTIGESDARLLRERLSAAVLSRA
jgi:hypothetical protein